MEHGLPVIVVGGQMQGRTLPVQMGWLRPAPNSVRVQLQDGERHVVRASRSAVYFEFAAGRANGMEVYYLHFGGNGMVLAVYAPVAVRAIVKPLFAAAQQLTVADLPQPEMVAEIRAGLAAVGAGFGSGH